MRKRLMVVAMIVVMTVAAITPLAATGKKYIDESSNYMHTWNTEAVIDPSAGAGGGSNPGDGSDPSAPVVKHCWILPDEDLQKECVQIHINPSDWRTDIYAWMVVKDPEGRDDIYQVFAQVFYPRDVPPWCGSEKYKETEFDPLDLVSDEDEILEALDDAVLSGHLTKKERDEIVHEVFEEPEAYVYKIQLPMEYCEPCGIYKVRMWATDSDSSPSLPCTALFEWKATVVVEYDFTSLDFGKIEAGVEKVIPGDEDLRTRDAPTLKNEGNTKVHIQLKAQEMTNTEYDQYKITDFDVYWMGNYFEYSTEGQSGDWTPWTELEPDLCLCQTKQIDFSIHPRENLPPGTYTGKLMMHISQGDWGEPTCSEGPWEEER
ncbi:MAG TPA: hypothetical protein ENI45_01145 [Thermoplasmatales archaeon]|nr:hypothetical protein [Thermoplasmatales archaeon]